jgi:cysteinyl-tRNA synthetase
VHLLFILLLYFIYLFYTSPLLHAADIDDKIIARAGAVGEDPLALSRRFIDEFHVDMVRGALERDRDGNILSK